MNTALADKLSIGRAVLLAGQPADRKHIDGSVYVPSERRAEVAKKVSAELKRMLSSGLLALTLLSPATAWAEAPFTDANCVRALVGEACGQGWQELLAHAHALRNRGTLQGVYGYNAKHLKTEPKSSWARVKKAWDLAKSSQDIVGGRTEWLSEYDHKLIQKWPSKKREKFLGGLKEPLKIGQTTFYRRVK